MKHKLTKECYSALSRKGFVIKYISPYEMAIIHAKNGQRMTFHSTDNSPLDGAKISNHLMENLLILKS